MIAVAWRDLCDWVFYQKHFGCGWVWLLELGMNMLKHIEGFSRWKELGSKGNLTFLVGKRGNILITKHIMHNFQVSHLLKQHKV